ncbi:hypothetical protein KC19_VG118700, partial [Ceratodon purpureus]
SQVALYLREPSMRAISIAIAATVDALSPHPRPDPRLPHSSHCQPRLVAHAGIARSSQQCSAPQCSISCTSGLSLSCTSSSQGSGPGCQFEVAASQVRCRKFVAGGLLIRAQDVAMMPGTCAL